MARAVNYTASALKYLRRVPSNNARLIRSKIDSLAAGIATNNATRMVNSDTLRLRVGDYRVVYYLTDTTMEVVKIGPRGSVYE